MKINQAIAGLCLAALLSACGGGGGDSAPAPIANTAPVSNAGPNQSVMALVLVTLDGSASTDANSDPLTYLWTLSSKPAGSVAVLSSSTLVKPTFTADIAGSYGASLVVNDGKDNSATTTVTVTAAVANAAPVANAGAAQNVVAGTVVTLTGAVSSDANNDPLTYAWTLTSKPPGSAAALTNATAVAPTFVADMAGSYMATLVVNDGKLNSAAATITVTAAVANVAPVANAGVAQNVVAGNLVTLDGSASSDANGDLLTYAWTLTSKPAGSAAALSLVTSAKPTLTVDMAGTYVATLVVNDGKLNSTASTVTIEKQPPRPLTNLEKRVVEAGNSFGLKLFNEISKDEANKNVFVSPLSISMALGMTLNGANGSTLNAMQNTLGLAGLTNQEINETYKNLIALFTGLDSKVIFQIANSIWHRPELQVELEFINTNKQYFNAEVNSIDFGSPSAAPTINGWVDKSTNGKIKEIVPNPIPRDVVMYLINAIYFKGPWKDAFKPANTRDETFYQADGSTVTRKMMNIHSRFGYFADNDVQVVDLPYGTGGYSMTVVLPKKGLNVDQLVATTDASRWASWIGGLKKIEMQLGLPKFTVEYKRELKEDLKILGMSIAFSDHHADFTRIDRHGGLYISAVQHKTFVDVNEEGTEAAAVTSVEVSRVSAPPVVRIDRPFLFVIRESHTGGVLFIGKIHAL